MQELLESISLSADITRIKVSVLKIIVIIVGYFLQAHFKVVIIHSDLKALAERWYPMFDWLLGIQSALAEAGVAVDPAAVEAPSTGAALVQMLLPMVLIVAVFYFMMIRPQRKKDKKVKDMLGNLKIGDRICTIGGMYGTVTGLREDSVMLSVGGKDTPLVLARWAIRNVEAVSVENEGEILA